MSSQSSTASSVKSDSVDDVRRTAHRLLDDVLDHVLEQGFFGGATLELASQNGKLCKCEADVRRRLRPPTQ